MTLKSVIPNEMTDKELRVICGHLQIAKNWGLSAHNVKLSNGLEYMVTVDRLTDYNEEITNRLKK